MAVYDAYLELRHRLNEGTPPRHVAVVITEQDLLVDGAYETLSAFLRWAFGYGAEQITVSVSVLDASVIDTFKHEFRSLDAPRPIAVHTPATPSDAVDAVDSDRTGNVDHDSDDNVDRDSDDNVDHDSDDNVDRDSDDNVDHDSDDNADRDSDDNVDSNRDDNVDHDSDDNVASNRDDNVDSNRDGNVTAETPTGAGTCTNDHSGGAETATDPASATQWSGDPTDAPIRVNLGLGGKAEFAAAVRSIATDVADGSLDPESIDGDHVADRLVFPAEPDLVIKTGAERLSDFAIWQSVYSELYFTDVNWRDFRKRDYLRAVVDFQDRQRRYGR